MANAQIPSRYEEAWKRIKANPNVWQKFRAEPAFHATLFRGIRDRKRFDSAKHPNANNGKLKKKFDTETFNIIYIMLEKVIL